MEIVNAPPQPWSLSHYEHPVTNPVSFSYYVTSEKTTRQHVSKWKEWEYLELLQARFIASQDTSKSTKVQPWITLPITTIIPVQSEDQPCQTETPTYTGYCDQGI